MIIYDSQVGTCLHYRVLCIKIILGTLGASANDWLINEFGVAMAGRDRSLQGLFNLVLMNESDM